MQLTLRFKLSIVLKLCIRRIVVFVFVVIVFITIIFDIRMLTKKKRLNK